MKFYFLFFCLVIFVVVANAQAIATDTLKPQKDSVVATTLISPDSLVGAAVVSPFTFVTAQNQAYPDGYFPSLVAWNYAPVPPNFWNLAVTCPVFLSPPFKDTVPIPGKDDLPSCVHHPAVKKYIPAPVIISAMKKEPSSNKKIIAGIISFGFLGTIFFLWRIRKK